MTADTAGSQHPVRHIVRPEQVPIREVWPREDADFTPWLAANLDWLDLLDLGPLTCEGTEVPIPSWNRNLDILATTSDGRRIAIENQYLEANHDHLRRGLAYATGLEAKALVIIAENHRPEFVAVADYLNHAQEQMGDDGIAVFLVVLGVEGVGDYLIPRLTVVSRPNQWRAAVHAAEDGRLTTAEDFLDACAPDQRERLSTMIAAWQARPDSSVRGGHGTLALNLRHPYKRGHPVSSVFLLNTTGQVEIPRGFYLETGAFDTDVERSDLDHRIRAHFPTARWTGKQYFLACHDADADQLAAFTDWLMAHYEHKSRQ